MTGFTLHGFKVAKINPDRAFETFRNQAYDWLWNLSDHRRDISADGGTKYGSTLVVCMVSADLGPAG